MKPPVHPSLDLLGPSHQKLLADTEYVWRPGLSQGKVSLLSWAKPSKMTWALAGVAP